MKLVTIVLTALCVLLAAQSASAQPFDTVTDSATYASLQQLSSAKLLGELSLPDKSLSRLEVALLVQQALRNYATASIQGSTDNEAEAALTSLSEAYGAELTMLGTPVAPPQAKLDAEGPTEPGKQALEDRVASIEAKLAEQSKPAEEPSKGECVDVDTTPITTSMYGNVYIHTRLKQTDVTPGTHVNFSDVRIYWGELGWDAKYKDWSGHFSVLLDDASDTVLLHEAWAKYQHVGPCGDADPWFFQVGKVLVPFGNNNYYFPTYPAVNDLGYMRVHAIGGGYTTAHNDLSAFAYNPRAEQVGGDDTISDYTATWNIAKRTADKCNDGYKVTVGYNSNLGATDLRIGGNALHSRVPGVNAFAEYDFNSDGHLIHLLADRTWALDSFDPAIWMPTETA